MENNKVNSLDNATVQPMHAGGQIANSNIGTNTTIDGKKSKSKVKRSVGDKFSIITLVIQIIITIGLGGLALAPVLNVFFGLCLFMFIVFGVIVTTLVSLGLAWTNEGFRNFWGNAWAFMGKAFQSADTIRDTFKGSIIWISILMVVLSSVGFVYNLIYYIKTKKNKTRFIMSCVFLGLALINMAIALIVYLK